MPMFLEVRENGHTLEKYNLLKLTQEENFFKSENHITINEKQ